MAAPRWWGPFAEMGAAAGTVYVVDKLVRRLSPTLRLHLHELVEQPVPGPALLPAIHAQQVRCVVLAPGAPEFAAMPRPPEIIQARLAQGAIALAVYLRGKYVGYAWLAFGHHDEDRFRCRFELQRAEQSAFDFDVYVFPPYRLGRAFAAVWYAIDQYLAQRGVVRTCSRIAGDNVTSRRVHAQLGARRISRALFVVVGRWQLTCSTALPFPWLHAARSGTPVLRL